MRTTLDIDEDVLMAAKEFARQRGQSTGKVLSDLVRQTLTRAESCATLDGIPSFPIQPGARVVTSEHVYQLMDELA